MTETRAGRLALAGAAGLVTLMLTLAPSALLVAIIALGAVGDAEFARLGPLATLGFVAIAVFAGYLVDRGLRRVSSEPSRRRPADVGIAFVVFLTILLAGVILIPVLIVFITVDSDHGLSDREPLINVLWFGGHLALTVIAWLAARALFNIERPDGDLGSGGQSVRRQRNG
jgi:uncharacterized membrane protein